MLDRDTHRLLALFGDAKEHSFYDTVKMGCILLKVPERKLEAIFKRKLLAHGWVRRCHKSWAPHLDMYQLTPKGDECFRAVQTWRITRSGHTDASLDHFRNFDRTPAGAHKSSSSISEQSAGLREKYPELYGKM